MSDAAFRFVVPSTGERLDRLVADATGRGRRIVRRWLEDGGVRVNGRIARAGDVPAAGSEVVVDRVVAGPSHRSRLAPFAPPAPFALGIVLEDPRFVVVAKPAGLHCERGKSAGSLADLLEGRYGDLSGVGERAAEAGLVHRIDRDTSGLVVAARDRATYRRLRAAFGGGAALKHYLALASGRLDRAIEVNVALARRAARMTPATLHDEALEATTWIEPLETGTDWTLVRASMRSGVMHQVRAHMAAAGHPLFGDSQYGGPSLEGCSRSGQLLHAMRVQITGELDVTVGPPSDFLAAYARLRRG